MSEAELESLEAFRTRARRWIKATLGPRPEGPGMTSHIKGRLRKNEGAFFRAVAELRGLLGL